jgi:hypothetical protein
MHVHYQKTKIIQAIMVDSRPFRFLDLPEEIRLMVYERLSIKTVHRPLCERYSTKSRRSWHTMYVWSTLPGIAILSVCRKVNAEATTVFQSQLKRLQDMPIRLLSIDIHMYLRTERILRSLYMIECSLDTSSIAHTRICRSLTLEYRRRLGRNNGQVCVHIAVRYNDEDDAVIIYSDRAWFMADYVSFLRRSGSLDWWMSMKDNTGRAMTLVVKSALPTAQEKDALSGMRRLQGLRCDENNHSKQHRTVYGDDIDETEWHDDWAQGERYM